VPRGKAKEVDPGKLGKVPETASVSAGALVAAVSLNEVCSDYFPFQFRLETLVDDNLVASIETIGQQVPVLLWRTEFSHKLVVIDGHRRIKALLTLGRTSVLAVIRDDLTEEQAIRVAFSANTSRAGFGPLDRANAVQVVRKRHGVTIEQAATFLGMTRSTAGRLAKLHELPSPLKEAVFARRLSPNHALVLGQLPAEVHGEWIRRVEEERLSIKQLKKALGKAKSWRKPTYLRRRGKGFNLAVRFSPQTCDPVSRKEMLTALKEAVALLEEQTP